MEGALELQCWLGLGGQEVSTFLSKELRVSWGKSPLQVLMVKGT